MKLRRRHPEEYTEPAATALHGSSLAPSQAGTAETEEPEEEATPADWREPTPAPGSTEETTEESEKLRRKRGVRIGQFFTGSVLSQEEFTRRLPVIVYIVFLMLLYIANGFHIQHKHSRLDQLADELKELKTTSVTSSAVRMTNTRQSEIERLLKEHNLPLLLDGTPPRIIEHPAKRQ